jgi:hypothetical protein
VSERAQVDRATFDALREFPARLERFYAAIPRGAENWRPDSWHGIPSEPFTPIEQLCHVRDIEIDGYHARFERTLREHEPVLANIDGEALARERDYVRADAARVLAQFRQARSRTLAMIETFTPEQLQRRAHFDGARTTVRGLVHLLCSHDQQHLSGLQWLLARIDAAGATAS